MKYAKAKYFKTALGDIEAYTFKMKVKDIVFIHYIATRGVDDEQGAVQRILNKRRIQAIKNYILDGNQFFSSFILNWANTDHLVKISKDEIEIPLVAAAAQVIDGQHRLAGLEAAMSEGEKVGEQSVIVTLCLNLDTSQAAKIFLNINTEQKPVPKSLIYDLFGEVESDSQHAINRATDIARELNDEPKSPLYRLIKFPGMPRGVGKIELSTFVSSLKANLERDGKIHAVNLKSLQHQKSALSNFFSAIKQYYEDEKIWSSTSKNPFFKAAGFNGAMDYFNNTLLLKCAEQKSFKTETISRILNLDPQSLLVWEDMKGLDGKTARKKVTEYLEQNLMQSLPDQDDYEF